MITIDVDMVKIEGSWWGNEAPSLVMDELGRGRVRKRVRVRMSASIISEIARKLWALQKQHAEVSASLQRNLSSPS
jgi:hypothetical protein